MFLDDFWHIIARATLVDFICIAVENFVKFVASSGFVTYWMNAFATFVEMDLLKWVG